MEQDEPPSTYASLDRNGAFQKITSGILLRDSVASIQVNAPAKSSLVELSDLLAKQQPPEEAEQKNVLVIGRFGHGKSSLINFFCGENVARVGESYEAETKEPCRYEYKNIVSIVDTPGLEPGTSSLAIKEVLRALLYKFDFHLIWYVRQASDYRFDEDDVKELQIWKQEFDVPILLVLNRTNMKEQRKLHETWRKILCKPEMMHVINEMVMIEAIGDDEEVPFQQLSNLSGHTFSLVFEPKKARDLTEYLRAKQTDMRVQMALAGSKRALLAVAAAVPIAGVVGLSPVPFLDQVLMIPILVGMASGICASFRVKINRGVLVGLMCTILGGVAVGVGTVTGVLKLIPIVNIASMLIDGALCSCVALCVGLSLILVLKRLIEKGVDVSNMPEDAFRKEFMESVQKKFDEMIKRPKSEQFKLLEEEVEKSKYHETDVSEINVKGIKEAAASSQNAIKQREKEREAKLELAKNKGVDEEDLCVVCWVNRRNIVMDPCGHECLCEADWNAHFESKPLDMRLCPLCRTPIQAKVRRFIPVERNKPSGKEEA
eukprot:TRINITY_DN1706_c0_g1_i1.p1 TRINITY_DN1706_c0_g1~~TRINITY_DN1706_c0_g1_i1.p1  ORF type:complete len:546 (+),score=128.44 TRINITY_DN1706_c0_g1_i1:195-1832(+)